MLTARPLLEWALGPGQFGAIARGALPSRVGEKLLNRHAASARGVGVHQSGSNGVPSPPQVRRPSAPLLRSGPSTAEVACSRRSPPQVRAPFPGSPVGSSRIRPATRRRTRPSSETHTLRAASRPGARIISSPRTSRPLHRPWRCGSGRSSARTPRRASGRQPYPRSTDQDHSRSGEPVYGRRRPDHRPEAGSEVTTSRTLNEWAAPDDGARVGLLASNPRLLVFTL